ncbi:hypothetical protein AQI84_18115 [Streptomyces griseorubiginosus]|nr:hypothetical protein AQI84_18115 [Streptomyces griseorubiginosus]
MPGTVLLLAASPVGKSCLVDAASVLPVLAAVPPAVLSGTETANVVELADPLEPQAVLTRLRAVAATPGPLTVFVAGQLALDRRQHLPHLALARTTPATVRYTALPWQWIREEFRLRTPGSTTLFLDLHADAETWGWLRTHALDSGRNNAVYGRIAPPPSRRKVAVPAYMKTIATILRSGHRPAEPDLHQQAFGRLGSEAYGDIVLTVPSVPVAAPGRGATGVWPGAPVQGGSSAQVSASVGAVSVAPVGSVQPTVSARGVVSVPGGASVQPGGSVPVGGPAQGVVAAQRMAVAYGAAPGPGVAVAQQAAPAHGGSSAEGVAATHELIPAHGGAVAQGVAPAQAVAPVQGVASAQGVASGQGVASAQVNLAQEAATDQRRTLAQGLVSAQAVTLSRELVPAPDVAPGQEVSSAQGVAPSPDVAPAQRGTLAQDVDSAPKGALVQRVAPAQESSCTQESPRTHDVPPVPRVAPGRQGVAGQVSGVESVDPHAYIAAAVQSGRHQEAEVVAAAHGEAAARDHGAASEQALHWAEVRADLAMFAGDPVRSCRIWLTVAEARLGAGQAVDAGPVETAVDRAHHQWAQVRDGEQVRQLGIVLAGLRMRVPGRRQGALENVQTQLRKLQTQG